MCENGTAGGNSAGLIKTLRALIVDDHAIVREGLKQLVKTEFKGAVIGEAESGEQALKMAHDHQWDIVLLDLAMPGCGGLDVLQELKELYPQTPVLVFSMHPEEQFAVPVLKAGASGYLTKNSAGEEIVEAIKKTLAGEKYVSDSLAAKLALGNEVDGKPHNRLSAREAEVMRMLGTGKSVKEIGCELGLSARTVSTYRARLLGKMHLVTNAQIVRYTLLNHLVE